VSKCIVPISGGLDSTVLLHYAVKSGRFDNVYAVSFNYGQRHDKELLYAEKTVKELKIPHKVVDLRFFNSIADTSSLTNPDIDVAKTRDVLGDAQTVNYVPFRNQMLLTICSAMAESAGASANPAPAARALSQQASRQLVRPREWSAAISPGLARTLSGLLAESSAAMARNRSDL